MLPARMDAESHEEGAEDNPKPPGEAAGVGGLGRVGEEIPKAEEQENTESRAKEIAEGVGFGVDRSEARIRPMTTTSGLRKIPKPSGAQTVRVCSMGKWWGTGGLASIS